LGEPVNSPYWDSQPCLSPDGRTIYFVSTRPGGIGKSDIWRSRYNEEGYWAEPENLGSSINTPYDEMAPFVHPDGHSLYFSSAGHPGMGGLDLFVSRMDENGDWQEPINLGYPINTSADEINIIVDASGKSAYISSDKEGGYGNKDVYTFDLYEEIRPNRVTYMKGIVFDAETNARIGANFELIDIHSGEVITESFSDSENGEFLLVLPLRMDYALNVNKENYLFYSENINLTEFTDIDNPFIVSIPLVRIREGAEIVLDNIFFEIDKYDLKEQSIVELEKLYKLLENNPEISILIKGHTDNTGQESYNFELSMRRAEAVYNYLVDKGISAKRLDYKGYGATVPISDNTSEEGRKLNRRTEVEVVKINL